MALPKSYLTSTKNLPGIMNSIVGAQAPEKFTTRFLESLGYKTSADRLVIGLLKSLGFLADDGKPTQRYYDYLDQTRSEEVIAEALRDAYRDLFQINKTAQKMGKSEIVNKFRTLTQGQYSEAVLNKMAMTFTALCGLADFEAVSVSPEKKGDVTGVSSDTAAGEGDDQEHRTSQSGSHGLAIGGLVYNIQLVLPESRDPKVYDALFQSLRKHLS